MLGNNPLEARSRTVPAKTYEFVLQWLNPFLLAGPNWSKKNIGVMGQYYCEACGGLETFRYQVRYIYIHFLFMLSFVVRRRYVMACDRCGASLHVEAENIKELLGSVCSFTKS